MNRVTVNLEPGIRRELESDRMTTVAQTRGIFADEDVFDRIAAARYPSRRPKVTLLVSTDPRLGEESGLYKNLRE
jgi:hypothetical protein